MKMATAMAVACLSVVGLAAGQDAQAVVRHYDLNIPKQSLDMALRNLAHQTGLQIALFSDTIDGNAVVGPILGTQSAEEALKTLLTPSGLSYKVVSNGTIAVLNPKDAPVSAPGASAKRRSFFERLKISQATSTASQEGAARRDEAQRAQKPEIRVTLEEIIVTAQRREERLIDVPISIVALGADELEQRKINTIDDLRQAVPGLTILSTGATGRRIVLRGISNSFGSSSLIGMYLDEVAVTSGPGTQLDLRTYDLERVEVLRGPQGTLYGSGSAGGTLRFITENPKLDRFVAKTDIAASFTQDGEPSQRIEGVVNVPLIDNELGLRIAGTFDRQGGWLDQPAAGKEDVNDQKISHVRAKGLWQPSSQLAVNAMAVIYRNDGMRNVGEDPNGNFTQVFDLTTTPSVQDDYDIFNLTLTYDFSAARLLSATSYVEQDKEQLDYGGFTQRNAPPAPRFRAYTPMQVDNRRTWTEEIRLMSQGSGPWQWTLGGIYQHVRGDTVGSLTQDGLPREPGAPLPTLLYAHLSDQSESGAIFGDASYQLTARMKFGAGLRYFEDDQESQRSVAFAPAPLGPKLTGKFHTLNPRIYLQYKWTEDLNTYASAAKGFRSGGFNNLNQPAYDPESVWTYELGAKMSLAEGRVSTDAALFYSDYSEYQVNGLVPSPPSGALLNLISNNGNAKIRGIEWGLTWRPTDQWSLSVNGAYTDSEFVEVSTAPNPITGLPTASYGVGDELPAVPKYSYTVSTEHEWTWSDRPVSARLDYNQIDRMSVRARDVGPWFYYESDVLNLLNWSLGLQWNEALSLGLFAQNLLNDRGTTTPFGSDGSARSRPRTYGIDFSVRF